MHENGMVGNWLAIIGVVSLIYWGWRVVVALKNRGSAPVFRQAADPPQAAPAQAVSQQTVSDNDLVVIAAAAYAAIGEHRIVHVEAAAPDGTWAAEGRWLQQTSHRPR
jgi:hypothetical protein